MSVPKPAKAPARAGSDDESVEGSVDLKGIVTATSTEKLIKHACRHGLNTDRGNIWMRLAGAADSEERYVAALERVFGTCNEKPSKIYRVPFLGVEPMALPPSATELMHQPSISLSASHDRVVCVLAQLHGLRYCPMLSNLGLLLLRHVSESQTFAILETLLKDSREEWFQKSWEDEVAFVNTFQDIFENRHAKLATHLESLGGGTFSFYGSWFRAFFVGWLPSEDTFKIVDCYLSEGPKVLIRFGISFLKLCSKELMKATSDNDAEDVLREYVSMRGFAGKYSFEALSDAAFSIRNFSRKTIYTLYEKHRSMIGDLAGDDEDMMATAYRHPTMWYNPKLTGPRSKLLERTFRMVRKGKAGKVAKEDGSEDGSVSGGDKEKRMGSTSGSGDGGAVERKTDGYGSEDSAEAPSSVLTSLSVAASPQLSALMSWLPECVSLCDWSLVYATHQHGRGLSNFYARSRLVGPTLMLVQARVKRSGTDDVPLGPSASPVFGFYSSRPFVSGHSKPGSKKAAKWSGSLDSFMFQLLPDLTVTGVTTAATAMSVAASRLRKDKAVDLRSNYSGTVLRCDYFSLCTPDFLAIGGNPVTTEVAFRMHTDMEQCEMSADMLRDLGVFSLLKSATSTATAAAGGAGAGSGTGVGADADAEAAASVASPSPDADPAAPLPTGGAKMGTIQASEREIVLELLEVEVFGFADRSGNFLADSGPAVSAAGGKSTPGKDKDGWF